MLTVLRIANVGIWAALLACMFTGARSAVTGKEVRRGDPMRLGLSAVCLVMILSNVRWLLMPESDALFAAIYVLSALVGLYVIMLGRAYGRGPRL
jgi:drug/metabolite transporter (DMT)-like permease